MTPNGQIAIPLDKAAIREPFSNGSSKQALKQTEPMFERSALS